MDNKVKKNPLREQIISLNGFFIWDDLGSCCTYDGPPECLVAMRRDTLLNSLEGIYDKEPTSIDIE